MLTLVDVFLKQSNQILKQCLAHLAVAYTLVGETLILRTDDNPWLLKMWFNVILYRYDHYWFVIKPPYNSVWIIHNSGANMRMTHLTNTCITITELNLYDVP